MKRLHRGNTKVILIVVISVFFVMGLACCGLFGVALFLPAVQQARIAAQRMESQNNLKRIGLALHNYHDTYGQLPPAVIYDENGKPMHSWRVAILPYLEQNQLFQQYDFSQAWDSPANIQLSKETPACYRSPATESQYMPGMTIYVAIAGPNTVLNTEQAIQFRQIVVGLSNVIAVVEDTQTPVLWTEPTDIAPQQFLQTDLEAGYFPVTNALITDGSVRAFGEVDKPQVQTMLSIDGS